MPSEPPMAAIKSFEEENYSPLTAIQQPLPLYCSPAKPCSMGAVKGFHPVSLLPQKHSAEAGAINGCRSLHYTFLALPQSLENSTPLIPLAEKGFNKSPDIVAPFDPRPNSSEEIFQLLSWGLAFTLIGGVGLGIGVLLLSYAVDFFFIKGLLAALLILAGGFVALIGLLLLLIALICYLLSLRHRNTQKSNLEAISVAPLHWPNSILRLVRFNVKHLDIILPQPVEPELKFPNKGFKVGIGWLCFGALMLLILAIAGIPFTPSLLTMDAFEAAYIASFVIIADALIIMIISTIAYLVKRVHKKSNGLQN